MPQRPEVSKGQGTQSSQRQEKREQQQQALLETHTQQQVPSVTVTEQQTTPLLSQLSLDALVELLRAVARSDSQTYVYSAWLVRLYSVTLPLLQQSQQQPHQEQQSQSQQQSQNEQQHSQQSHQEQQTESAPTQQQSQNQQQSHQQQQLTGRQLDGLAFAVSKMMGQGEAAPLLPWLQVSSCCVCVCVCVPAYECMLVFVHMCL